MKKLLLLLSVSIALAQNYSLSFDGVDDYVELPDIDLLGNYTISMNVLNISYDGGPSNLFNKYHTGIS